MHKYDFLIVGCGLFGATLANKLSNIGKKVLIIEKRNHIGGNIYTENICGINVHKYGAHIFHTNNKLVWNYVNQFADFNRYTNSPVANYHGEIYSLPFNMHTFSKMWNISKPEEAYEIIQKQRKEINKSPENLEEQAITLVGRDVYEKLVKGYTEKQWGRKCDTLPPFIIKRLPVRFTYDNNYFNALYQGIPIGGYTQLIKNMIGDCELILNTDYLKNRSYYDSICDKVIFTGPIDEYFDYKLGHLEYRTVHFESELINCENYQGNAVVNYTDSETPFTRIIEHKWFEFGKDINGNDIPVTYISKEYSKEWKPGDEPYYPINNEENNNLYNAYKELSKELCNVYFGGRLGLYQYFDMDRTIEEAFKLFDEIVDK